MQDTPKHTTCRKQSTKLVFAGGSEACLHVVQEQGVVDVHRGFLYLGGSLPQGVPSLTQLAETVTLGAKPAVQKCHILGEEAVPAANEQQLFPHVCQNLHATTISSLPEACTSETCCSCARVVEAMTIDLSRGPTLQCHGLINHT